jgi:5-methylcytosine-specific restriction endonuclease McrA
VDHSREERHKWRKWRMNRSPEAKRKRRALAHQRQAWWHKIKRRARHNVIIPYTREQHDARLAMYASCWICREPFTAEDPMTRDHVKPLSAGGYECLANLRPAHSSCNNGKHSTWHGVGDVVYITKHGAWHPKRVASSFKQYWRDPQLVEDVRGEREDERVGHRG